MTQHTRVMLEIVCDVCGSRTTLEPLPQADPVPLDNVWFASIESQALDSYAYASGQLRDCQQCAARSSKLVITNPHDHPVTVTGSLWRR